MALTQDQLTTLKNDIAASEFAALPNNDDAAFLIAGAYNLTAAPNFTVWRTDIPTRDVKKNVNWTEFIGRSQGERDAFQFMLSNGTINGADANVRQGIVDIFSGPSGVSTRTALTALAKRLATRAEKLFASGTGSDASPATSAFGDGFKLSFQDISQARNLP